MAEIEVDKIASVTKNVALQSEHIEYDTTIPTKAGTLLLVRALEEKRNYNELELLSGRMSKVLEGNLIVGVLGERRAIRGIVGIIPESLQVGDKVHLLNLGGVLGKCVSFNKDVGAPIECEVLGAVIINGKVANIGDEKIPWRQVLAESAPIVAVSGTSMHAGKTTTACILIKKLSRLGFKVGGLKVTGVALLRDTLKMKDYGAKKVLHFADVGL